MKKLKQMQKARKKRTFLYFSLAIVICIYSCGDISRNKSVSNRNEIHTIEKEIQSKVEKTVSKKEFSNELANAIYNENINDISKLVSKDINTVFYENLTPLFFAIKECKFKSAKEILRLGANVNTKGFEGWTPLHFAANFGCLDIVKMLVQNGANINSLNKKIPPVVSALNNSKNNFPIVKYLIDKGAKTETSYLGSPYLFFVAEEGRFEILKYLIEEKGFQVDEKDSNGSSILMFSIIKNYKEIVPYILKRGIDMNSVNNAGFSVLHLAVERDDLEAVKFLIENGADKDLSENMTGSPHNYAEIFRKAKITKYFNNLRFKKVEERLKNSGNMRWLFEPINVFGQTLFHWIAENGRTDLLREAIRRGAMVDAKCQYQKTCLHYAAKNNQIETARFLLSKSANIESRDYQGHTPIYRAAVNGKYKMVEFLLSKGAKLNIISNNRSNILHDLIKNNTQINKDDFIKTVELVISKGINVNQSNKYDGSPIKLSDTYKLTNVSLLLIEGGASNRKTKLHIAVMKNDIDLVKKLSKNKKYINSQDKYKRTPLHWASITNNLEIANELIKSGAKLNIKDRKGRSPIFYAIESKSLKVVTLLVKHGANVNHKAKYGETPLYLAAGLGSGDNPYKIIKLLIDSGAKVNSKDVRKMTPFHNLMYRGSVKQAKLFLDKGADMNAKNNSGWPPVVFAINYGTSEMIIFLVNQGVNLNVKCGGKSTPRDFIDKNRISFDAYSALMNAK